MASAPSTSVRTVALIGNPNTGKSTLFSALAGVRQRVGNYPGVTVEKKVGHFSHAGVKFALIDLPGTYSLAPRSPDEMVAVDVLLGRRDDIAPPDAVICIVDASNLERNLYLVSQALELGLPTILALNMLDVAAERGIRIDTAELERRLGVPVVGLEAHRRRGLEQLREALGRLGEHKPRADASPFPDAFRAEVARLQSFAGGLPRSNGHAAQPLPRYLAERLLLDTSGYLEQALFGAEPPFELKNELAAARGRLATAGAPAPAVEAMSRYAWVARTLEGVVAKPAERPRTFTDRIDRVLTHKWWGSLVFVLAMGVVFSSIFWAADPLMGWIDEGIGALGEFVAARVPEGPVQSLLVSGVIGGVGGVVIFLPQILILFFFIGLLEDCGYMARAAYLMDKVMVRVGLSGKSFIPLLSSFACAVPGIMATRVIEDRRDRLTTILIAPLMSCAARLPVYTILIGAFVPLDTALGPLLPGLVMLAMYLVGVVAAVVVAWTLKKTVLRGETPPFVLELPSYKWPSATLVLHRMAERGWAFVYRAGTVVLAASVVIWALGYYPHDVGAAQQIVERQRSELTARVAAAPAGSAERRALNQELAEFDEPANLENRLAGAMQANSYLGRMGRAIEPVVRPLGWDWRIGCAAIASFPAREVVMGVLGVIYNLGEVDVGDEEGQGALKSQLRAATWDGTNEPVYNLPVALSIMVFFALCAQCVSTLAIIRRETNGWAWPVFTFTYMTVLAYFGALVTYQVGRLWL